MRTIGEYGYVRIILTLPFILLGWFAFIIWEALYTGWDFGEFLRRRS